MRPIRLESARKKEQKTNKILDKCMRILKLGTRLLKAGAVLSVVILVALSIMTAFFENENGVKGADMWRNLIKKMSEQTEQRFSLCIKGITDTEKLQHIIRKGEEASDHIAFYSKGDEKNKEGSFFEESVGRKMTDATDNIMTRWKYLTDRLAD